MVVKLLPVSSLVANQCYSVELTLFLWRLCRELDISPAFLFKCHTLRTCYVKIYLMRIRHFFMYLKSYNIPNPPLYIRRLNYFKLWYISRVILYRLFHQQRMEANYITCSKVALTSSDSVTPNNLWC